MSAEWYLTAVVDGAPVAATFFGLKELIVSPEFQNRDRDANGCSEYTITAKLRTSTHGVEFCT